MGESANTAMIESTVSVHWLRRYRTFFVIGIVLLCIQLLLAYLLPIFSTSDDIFNTNSLYSSLIDGRNARNNKAAFDQLFQEESLVFDDEDISNANSNAIANFKEAATNMVMPKVLIAKDDTSNNQALSNSNAVIQPPIISIASAAAANSNSNSNSNSNNVSPIIASNIKLDNLKFKPICDIVSKEAISAVHRAQTQSCKEIIVNTACAIQMGTFYPKQLLNSCPHQPYVANRPLGCYKDDKKFRTLSGYYINFKTTNTPKRCIQLCLQSGFVYAGVQYSTECFCGNTIPDDAIKLPDPECNYKCSGDAKQSCGGYFTISIYETGVKKFVAQTAEIARQSEEPKVRIAFLLTLNGRAVRQVHRLLKLLYSEQHFFYIHVDSRQDYMFRELLKLEAKSQNIRLTRSRFSTIWGGASLLKMLLASMTELLHKTEWKWDFIINLSESDFLVKSTDNLVEFLSANRDKNFVKSHGREVQRFIQKQGLDKSFVECDTHMWRIGDRELPQGIEIDGGSDWVGLSRTFVEYVTSYNSEPDELLTGLLRIFHHTLLPAESFFHTALRNSKFCDTYVDNNLHVTNWKRRLGCKCQYKHVVDWCGCSPNDFKTDDWTRLVATYPKQLFFARKFEPIVNQDVILRLEEWLVGPYPTDYPSLRSYWQSVYSIDDKGPKIDESFITVASTLACQRLHPNYTMKSVLEISTFMERDHYKGFLIHHGIVQNDDPDAALVELELFARPEQFGKVSRASTLGKRIKNVEVSTDYDQKEQLLRNFAKIMGQNAEPTFVLHLTPLSADAPVPTSGQYNLTVLWINPAGHLGHISDLLVDASSSIQTVFFVKSSLKTPLLPGVWTAKLVNKQSLLAQCKFLIVPRLRGNGNGDVNVVWSDTHLSVEKSRRKKWDNFLAAASELEAMREQALFNANLVDDEQILWISKLISEYFVVKQLCARSRTAAFAQMQQCNETAWSSFAPDPKSNLFA